MPEKRINLQRYAMHFGTYMGVYWVAKFILFPIGLTQPLFMFLFIVLTIAVPFVGYNYARNFRNKFCDGSLSFMQAWAFMVSMYIFAALLVAVAHYIYFRFIDNGFVINAYEQTFEASKSIPGFSEIIEQYPYQETLDQIRALSPIEITVRLLSQNMLYCSILALITAPFVARKKQIIS